MELILFPPLSADSVLIGAHLSRPVEEFENDHSLETAWAFKAIEHMEVYFNLLCAVDPKLLKLTPHDDKIYEQFRKEFHDFNVDILNEESLKSEEAKKKWRPFCNRFEGIVEDFNFGTMIRIDSSDEYSERNSIFVPRIQFYAIEIARNREGCNDNIRKKFKSIPRHSKNERYNTSRTDCLLVSFIHSLQEFFNTFCRTHLLSKINIKELLRKENGTSRKGDFSIYFGKPRIRNFCTLWEKISSGLVTASQKWNLPISYCTLLPTTHFQINLVRTTAFREVLLAIIKAKQSYGKNCSYSPKKVLIVANLPQEVESKRCNELTYFRTRVAAEHIAALLGTVGYQVYFTCGSPQLCYSQSAPDAFFSLKKNISIIQCCKTCDPQKVESTWEKAVRNLVIRVPNSEFLNKSGNACNQEDFVILNGKLFLQEHNIMLGSKGYDKNIGYIYAKKEQWTEYFHMAALLEHIVQTHLPKNPDVIVHVVPHPRAFFYQQVGVLWDMISGRSPKQQMFFILEPVTITNLCNKVRKTEATIEKYLGEKELRVKKALTHKYGEAILTDCNWSSCIKPLAYTWMKFDLLMTSCSLPVKMNFEHCMEDQNSLDLKGGIFVQYNCARLVMIFQNYQQKVDSGIYPPLPPIEEVDFAHLKLEEEWKLLFNYLLPFSFLLQEVVQPFLHPNIRPQVQTNKICQMLVNLSHDLSTYYSRIHILVEPRPHLMPCLTARFWLLKGLHQIMENSLNLLGISPLKMM